MGIVLKWNFKTLLADQVRVAMAILCVIFGNATTIGLCALLDGFASGIGSLNTDDSLFRFLSVVFPPMSQALMGLSMFAMFSVYLAESRQQRTLMYNVGATKKMLVRALLTEAFLLSLIGISAGSAVGLLAVWLQLRQLGISADLRQFLFSADAARCILPSLLIVPAAMLAACARTAFIGTVKKKLPGKKRKAAFGGGLLNKLLGAGGRLGHARSAGGNPGGRPVVASVVAAFTLLFLMTTGLSIVGSTQSSFSEQDFINVYFWVSEDSLSDLPEILNGLDQVAAEGLQGEAWCSYEIRCEFLGCVVSDGDIGSYLDDEIFNDVPVDIGQGQFLIRCNVSFIAHEDFIELCDECGVSPQKNGAILKEDSRYPLAGKSEFIILPEEVYSDYYGWAENESDIQNRGRLVNEAPEYAPDIIGQAFYDARTEDSPGYLCPTLYYDIGYWNEFCASVPADGKPGITPAWYLNSENFDKEHPEFSSVIQSYLSGLGFSAHIATLGDGYVYHPEPGRAVITSSGYQTKSFESFKEQLKQFYVRYFTVMIFITVLLDVICIVHMDRFAQRKEYAILTSIGLSPSQRIAMQVYYAIVFTVKVVFFGIIAMLLLSTVIAEHASDAISNEQLEFSSVVISEWSDNFFGKMWYTAIIISRALSGYVPFVIAAVVLLFVSYLVTDILTTRRLDRKELITIIKDDMQE